MDSFILSLVKYLLFVTNFVTFVLGCVTFGLGVWVFLDKPSVLCLFQMIQAQSVIGGDLDIDFYTFAAYIIMVVSLLISIVSFFGCSGSIKENRCMLGTYFALLLGIFTVAVVGSVLVATGHLTNSIKLSLLDALDKYEDKPSEDTPMFAYKEAWNLVQKEMKCCGIDSVGDWIHVKDFPEGLNKPKGCCMWEKPGKDISNNSSKIEACRKSTDSAASADYYFAGCYTQLYSFIDTDSSIVLGGTSAVLALMFINLLFSFTMCILVPGHTYVRFVRSESILSS
eukprot:GFUD01016624.1.p1 GENE.GFUD01016624.1~~GFUD01016624.1.p1  ORF type:complete len:283 (+),score=60.62 GFUD01016624.1:61-909(+)